MSESATRTPANFIPVPRFGLTEQEGPAWQHLTGVAAGSVLVHALFLVGLVQVIRMPATRFIAPGIVVESRPREVTKLVAPPVSVLTQRSPNRGEVTREFNIASLPPRPAQPNVPASPGAAAAPRRQFRVPEPSQRDLPSAAVPEAPAIATAELRSPPPPAAGAPVPVPAPNMEPPDEAKLKFEPPGVTAGTTGTTGPGRVAIPRPTGSVAEAMRQAARGSGRGLIVGDADAIPGAMPSSPTVPIPGKLGSAVELLSDPMGVDFWPYMVRVLSAVRRNWFAVIPESARLGRQGRTVVQFAINRDGTVPKLVISGPSGAEALDRAAVAGVSASNPFPPLPPDFKGGQIRLQFVFKYNVR